MLVKKKGLNDHDVCVCQWGLRVILAFLCSLHVDSICDKDISVYHH